MGVYLVCLLYKGFMGGFLKCFHYWLMVSSLIAARILVNLWVVFVLKHVFKNGWIVFSDGVFGICIFGGIKLGFLE